MSLQVQWAPTAAALETALANAGVTAADRAVGKELLSALKGQGPYYDALFTQLGVAASKGSNLEANAKRIAAWREALGFEQADSVAAWGEGLQITANQAVTFNTHVQTVAGERYVLAPTLALAFDDTTPATHAQVVIGTLRVVARDVGRAGNGIAVTIADSPLALEQIERLEDGLGQSPELDEQINQQIAFWQQAFKITFARPGYVETIDAVRPGGLSPSMEGFSILVGRTEWSSPPARPANGSYTLSGGRGRALEALQVRLRRAALLPALSESERKLVRQYETRIRSTRRPDPQWSGAYGSRRGVNPSIREIEDEVVTLVGQAKAWLAAL